MSVLNDKTLFDRNKHFFLKKNKKFNFIVNVNNHFLLFENLFIKHSVSMYMYMYMYMYISEN